MVAVDAGSDAAGADAAGARGAGGADGVVSGASGDAAGVVGGLTGGSCAPAAVASSRAAAKANIFGPANGVGVIGASFWAGQVKW